MGAVSAHPLGFPERSQGGLQGSLGGLLVQSFTEVWAAWWREAP